MRVLLDECLPKRLADFLHGHHVQTVRQMNWQGLKNGKLLDAAEPQFDVFITVDKNLVHQQNLHGREIAVIILRAPSNDIDTLSPLAPRIISALNQIQPGAVLTIAS